jgi:hypothetical protein
MTSLTIHLLDVYSYKYSGIYTCEVYEYVLDD